MVKFAIVSWCYLPKYISTIDVNADGIKIRTVYPGLYFVFSLIGMPYEFRIIVIISCIVTLFQLPQRSE